LNCNDIEGLWLASEAGELAPRDLEALREHLQSCPECGSLTQGLKSLEMSLEALGDEDIAPPPFLKSRVIARLDDIPRRRSWEWIGRVFTSRRVFAFSTACLAFFAGLLAREVHRVNDWVQKGRAQEVLFEFQSPGARTVSLAGDFNGWGAESEAVRSENRDGRWVFRVQLEPGRYEYAFIVDGKKWLPDPGAAGINPDGFGGLNSLLYVQNQGTGRRLPL
jgi:hypothetical protein